MPSIHPVDPFSYPVPEVFEDDPLILLIWRAEPDWPVIRVTPNIRRLTGYDPEDFLSGRRSLKQLLPPRDKSRITSELQTTESRGRDICSHSDFHLNRADKSRVWVNGHTRIFRDDAGRPAWYLGHFTDVTEHHQQLDAMQNRLSRLSHALDGSQTGLWDWDAVTDQVFFSKVWKAMLGYREMEIGPCLSEWATRVHPEDRESAFADLQRHIERETDFYENLHRVKSRDGNYKWILDRGKVVDRDSDGNPLRAVGTHTDMTAYKEIEQRLAETENRYRSLFHSSPDGKVLVDPETRLPMEVNEAACRMLECDSNTLSAIPFDQWISGQNPQGFLSLFRISEKSGESRRDFEIDLRTSRGRVIQVHMTSQLIHIQKQARQYLVLRDISDKVRQREEMARREESLQLTQFSMDQAPLAIYWISADGHILYANQEAGRSLGYSPETLKNKSLSLIDSEYQDDRRKAHWKTIRQKGRLVFEARHRHREGWSFPVQITTRHLHYDRHEFEVSYAVDITETHRINSEMQAYSDRLALASRAGNFGIWEMDAREKNLKWDDRMFSLYGVSPDSFGGGYADWAERVHPDDLADIESSIGLAIKEKGRMEGEFRIIRPDGKTRHIRAAALVQRDSAGTPLRLVGVNLDVTREKNTEALLRRKSELLSATARAATALLFNSDFRSVIPGVLPDIGRAADADRVYMFENGTDAKGVSVTSQRFEWTSDTSSPQIDNPDLQDLPMDFMLEMLPALESDGFFSAIISNMPDSPLRDLLQEQDIQSILLLPIHVQDQLWGFVGFDDCTEQREWIEDEFLILRSFVAAIGSAVYRSRVEKKLKESENRYRGLVESQHDLVVRVDPDGRFTYVNDAYCRTFGKTREELIGRHFTPLVHEDDIGPTLEAMKGLAIPPYRISMEQRAMTSSGWRWLAWEDYAIRNDQDKTVEIQGVGRDITAMKETQSRLEEALEEARVARDRAEEANKTKTEFLANISHEIRTPMNSILGFSEILRERLSGHPEAVRHLNTIRASGDTLLGIINDLLDFSRIESGRLELNEHSVDMSRMAREAVQVLELEADRKSISLRLDIGSGMERPLHLDEIRLRQVLFNLVGNAVKFTHKGHVTLKMETAPSQWAEGEQGNAGRVDLLITVSDTGIGIPSDQQERVFEPFMQQEGQLSRSYGGTGLGLSISRRLLDLMGGIVSVESVPGEGSVFTIHLPGIRVADADDLKEKKRPERFVFAPATVLLVEDIAENRELIRELLSDTALTLTEVVNGLECLESVRKNRPDLVLMDLRMPVMDGFQALAEIRSDPALSDLTVLSVTASTLRASADLQAEGFDGHVPKPVVRADLFREIARFLPLESGSETSEIEIDDSFSGTCASDTLENKIHSLTRVCFGDPEVKQMLQTRLREWAAAFDELRLGFDMDRAAALAAEMAGFAEEIECLPLKKLADIIQIAAQSFDIAALEAAGLDLEKAVAAP